jgi:hypothetical protein
MHDRVTPWLWIQTGLAMLSAVIALLMISWPDWIEIAFHIDPDGHSGVAEWGVALGLLIAATRMARACARRMNTRILY